MRVPLFLFFAVFATSLFGQTVVDSLIATKQVDSLIKISRAFTAKRDLDKALEVNVAAEKIALEKLGWESAAYGSCAHNHGRVCYFKGYVLESEKWYLEALAIREKVVGKEHPDYAQSLNNLGVLYMDMGNYEKAESFQLQAKAIQEKVLGKEHPEYASRLNNLAVLYNKMGNYEKAEPLQLEALAIREKVLGKEHPDYTVSLNNLAVLYKQMGNYEKAESLYLEALAIREKVLGKEHPDNASTLHNLAILYRRMGNYEKAEMLQLKALAIREKVFGKEHPDYAQSLNSLANLYGEMGNYKKAEMLQLETLALEEKMVGKKHPHYAGELDNLAVLYWYMGNYEKAESLYLEALAIREKVLGKEHPDYAQSLNNLAVLYSDMGNYEKAEPVYLEALAIREKVLGKEHPEYAVNLDNLAALYWYMMGNYEKARTLLQELTLVNQSLLVKAARHLSEREMGSYLNNFSKGNDKTLSFAQLSADKKIVPSCYDNALFYKGFLLQATGQLKRQAFSNPAAAEKFNLLKSYERRLAAQYAQPIAKRDSTGVANLEAKANDLEKDLARSVAGYGEAMRQVKWQEVQQKLDAGEAAVEFVRFHFSRKKQLDSTMYAALVLLPAGASAKEGLPAFAGATAGKPGNEQPIFVPLFEEKDLQNLIKTSGARKSDYVNGIYSNQKTTEKSLYELVWKPLEKSLADTKTVYFSPSGLLHRLNLNAIPINEKEILSDRYHLVEVGSTRQLVISPESTGSTPDAGQALLFGGVQYDLKSDSTASQNINIESNITGTRGERNFSFTDSTDRGGTWNYLKWTDKEVTALEPILKSAQIQTTLRKGYTATEEAFKSIGSNGKSPRILHIATHGYFFPDPKETPKSSSSGLGVEPVFKLSDHPMIRSGLILAGGNHAWKTGKPFKPGMEDGILTAYEISQMDLSNTELVVLSACETGLGDIQDNEGVYGLQRAFKIAGAKYLIMSLWQVPDFQTQELMTTFYSKWLKEGLAIPDAFRAAQADMRKKYEHPYFWAGFVLVE